MESHAQAATVGSLEAVFVAFIRLRFCDAEIAAPVLCPSEPTFGVQVRSTNDAKSRKLTKAACSCGSTTAVLPVSTSQFLCLCGSFVFFGILCLGFHRSQADSLDSSNTPCSSGLPTAVPTNNVLAWNWVSGSDFELFCRRSCHHRSLSCLSCLSFLLCQSCPPPSGASMQAWISLRTCSYVISRARIMARCCSNSLGTRASSAAVLMSSSRAAVVVPLDLLEPRFVAEELFALLHSEDPNDVPNVSALPDLMVLLKERSSKLSLSVKARSTDLFALFLNIVNWFCTQRTELSVKCSVRDDVVLIFHPFHPLGESRRFSHERWRFLKNVDVDQNLSFIHSVVGSHQKSLAIGNTKQLCHSRASFFDSVSVCFWVLGTGHSATTLFNFV